MTVLVTIETVLVVGLAAFVVTMVVGRQRSQGKNLGRPMTPSGLLADPPMARSPVIRREVLMPGESYRGLPDNHVLAPAPRVPLGGGASVSVSEWLRRYHPQGEKTLMNVVMELYRRASAVPEVADYLRNADMDVLPRHFHSVLTVMTSQGMTVGLARRMGAAHSAVFNSVFKPITPEIFDSVVGVLTQILTEQRIPDVTLRQIAATAEPLREFIAVNLPSEDDKIDHLRH